MPTTEAAAAGGSYYLMHCRGPFKVATKNWTRISGTKRSGSAGTDGKNLAPGECAWTNRGLNSAEQPEIIITALSTDTVGQSRVINQTTALSICALNESCIASLKVRNKGDGTMEAGTYPTTIHRK